MDSDVSVCIIPDTPSSSILGRKTLSQGTNSILEISSEDSFRISSSAPNSKETLSKLTVTHSADNIPSTPDSPVFHVRPSSPDSPVFHVRPSLSDSPVFNLKRNMDKSFEQNSNACNLKSETNCAAANSPALPGSPEFAQQRAKALKRKKLKDKVSPFSKSKYDLSPFKAGVNRLSACSSHSQSKVKSDLDSRWSPSPLETDEIYNGEKKRQKCPGFVKSSTLLGKTKPSTDSATVPVKTKRRKVETMTRNNTLMNDVVRPKVKKSAAKYSWPSSSDSNDDESFSNRKKVKKIGTGAGSAFVLKKTEGEIVNDATELVCGKKTKAKFKEWEKLWTASPSDGTGFCNNVPTNKLSAKSSSDKKVTESTRKEEKVAVQKWRGPIHYLDSSDDDFLMAVPECPANERSVQSSGSVAAGRQSWSPIAPSLSSIQPSLGVASVGLSPQHLSYISQEKWNHISPISNTSLYDHKTHYNSNTFSSPTNTPVKHFIYEKSPSAVRAKSKSPRQKKSSQSQWRLPRSLIQDSPTRLPRPRLQDASSDSPPGSHDNPIDLDMAATPETRKALQEIKQLQSDEDFARKMQEQLDLEFAMSLQNSEGSVSRPASAEQPPASSRVEESNRGHHWHAHSPTRVRATARANTGGARRRGRAGRHPDEEFVQLIRDTIGTLHAGMDESSNDAQFNTWLEETLTPPVSRRRRGGRAGAWMMFSPADGGQDYENLMELADMLGEVKNKGLTKSDLVRLPVVAYKKTEGQETEECNICMTDYENGDSQKILPCFHSFHPDCIDKWMKKNATCPICRVEVKVNSP